jgi:hypothetical protein
MRRFRPLTRAALTAAAVSLLVSGVVAATPGTASADASSWCGAAAPTAPCIVSATRDGVDVGPSDPTYDLYAVMVASGDQVMWGVSAKGGGFSLPIGDLDSTWAVTVNVRSLTPRFTYAHSTRGPVTRSTNLAGEHIVTMQGRPVTVTSECNGAGVCPTVATGEWPAYLDGSIYEANWYASSGVPASAWNGSAMWTNIDWTSFPPQVPPGGGLQLDIANSHYRVDGVTPVSGFIYEDLPYALVRQALFVDDPMSLVGGGVLAGLTGTGAGAVSVTADDAAGMLHVAGTGITFSHRALVVKRGITTPRSGAVVSAFRASPRTTVRVRVLLGVSRGAKVTGYSVRCYRLSGTTRTYVRTGYTALGHGLVVVVKNVGTTGARYCQARVNSTRGFGSYGKAVRVR